jgi:hypothetical protein
VEDTVISRGPTAYMLYIARGPAADDDTRAWAHRVSIKRMSPAPGIKFSRGPGYWIKAFLL